MDGTVEIDFYLANAQRCIVLGSAGLDISSVTLTSQDLSGKHPPATGWLTLGTSSGLHVYLISVLTVQQSSAMLH